MTQRIVLLLVNPPFVELCLPACCLDQRLINPVTEAVLRKGDIPSGVQVQYRYGMVAVCQWTFAVSVFHNTRHVDVLTVFYTRTRPKHLLVASVQCSSFPSEIDKRWLVLI